VFETNLWTVRMARWIAFDQQTSSLLRSKLLNSNRAQGAQIETFGRSAIDYALAKPGAVVTLLPAAGGLDVGIAVFRRPQKSLAGAIPAPAGKALPAPAVKVPAAQRSPSSLPPRGSTIRAGGFLGLSDELFEEEIAVEQKKAWWRRFWDE
jgi:hypothetical protein